MENNSNLMVSICIPTYNGEEFLQEALDSILTQSYRPLEVIVSDDNSSDGTLELVSRFSDTVKFPVHIFSHEPRGIGANWNNSIRKASGDYIKFLFQDDVLQPNCIEMLVEKMIEYPTLGMIASQRDFILEGTPSEVIIKWKERYKNLQREFINTKYDKVDHYLLDASIFSMPSFDASPLNKIGEPPTVLFRKSLVEEIGYFREDLKQILDYEFYYRVLKQHPIMILKAPLISFRIHDKQATNVNRNSSIYDYDLYPEILYKEYYFLLNKKLQNHLKRKYNFFYKWSFRIKNKTKLLFK
jgi:glycosyltransferase involved in cell wall biosynthesis